MEQPWKHFAKHSEIEEENIGIIIEVKYPDNGNLEQGCKEALEQIEARRYTEQLLADGMENIMKYGISCYRKKCRIKLECDTIQKNTI